MWTKTLVPSTQGDVFKSRDCTLSEPEKNVKSRIERDFQFFSLPAWTFATIFFLPKLIDLLQPLTWKDIQNQSEIWLFIQSCKDPLLSEPTYERS